MMRLRMLLQLCTDAVEASEVGAEGMSVQYV